MRKSEQARPYPPDYVSAETLAYRLDCSVRVISDYTKCGFLPPPILIGNLVRWRWAEIEFNIDRQNGLGLLDSYGEPIADGDNPSADIANIKSARAGRRRLSLLTDADA